LHFDVSHNRDTRVSVERWSLGIPEVPAFAGGGVPVSLDCPPPTLARVPEKRPSSELLIQAVVEQMKGPCTDHCTIVISPASDDRVEYADQVRLLGRLMLTDQRRQRRPVAFHRLVAWPDERFEATSLRRIVLARSVLTHLETKKVEACFTRDFFKRVGDARLLLTQLQADALQPCLRQVATLFDDGSVPVEDHQIVRVSDDLGLPMELLARVFRVPSRPGWKVRANKRFESVQRDVRQQWRRDATLWCAARRFGEHVVVEHPGLEPRFHEAVQSRECLELAEEGLLVDAVERSCMLMPPSRTRMTCLRNNIAPRLAGENVQHIDILYMIHSAFL